MTDTTQTGPADAGAETTPVVTSEVTPAETPDQATPAEAAEPQTESGKSEAETSEKTDAKRNSIKERIDRERGKRQEAERRAESAERTTRELRQQLQGMQSEYAKLDPNDVEGRQALQTRAAVKAERLEQLRFEQDAAQQDAAATRQAMFNAKLDAARERLPDFDQAMSSFGSLPVSAEAADLIAESDKAAEIAYFLAKNPAEAFRIDALKQSPARLGAEIARLEQRVTAAPVRKSSNAPPPVRTNLGGGSSPTAKNLSQMTTEEYVAHRRAEMAKGS
jgi:hypothetical protein